MRELYQARPRGGGGGGAMGEIRTPPPPFQKAPYGPDCTQMLPEFCPNYYISIFFGGGGGGNSAPRPRDTPMICPVTNTTSVLSN